MHNYLKTSLRFVITLTKRFLEDGCTYRAAALTYATLLSLVPLMTVSFAIFAAFPVFQSLSTQIQDFIFSHFLASSGEVIQQYITKFVAQTKHLSAIGSVFLVITSILMMFNMERAFNAIWRVQQQRKGVSALLLYWAVLTLGPILLGLSIIISSYITSLPVVSSTAKTLEGSTPFLGVMPFILSAFAFTLLYVAVPNCRVPIRYATVGGIVAAILFTLAKLGFGFYVSNFPTYTLLYGALATIPLFLIWLYLMWVIILFGAVLSNVLTTGYAYRSAIRVDGFTHVYRWLGHLWLARKQGRSLTIQQMVTLDSSDYAVQPEKQISLMLKANLIQTAAAGSYVLSEDLSNFSLSDLLASMPWRLPTEKELQRLEGDWEKHLLSIIKNKGEAREKSLQQAVADGYNEEDEA